MPRIANFGKFTNRLRIAVVVVLTLIASHRLHIKVVGRRGACPVSGLMERCTNRLLVLCHIVLLLGNYRGGRLGGRLVVDGATRAPEAQETEEPQQGRQDHGPCLAPCSSPRGGNGLQCHNTMVSVACGLLVAAYCF